MTTPPLTDRHLRLLRLRAQLLDPGQQEAGVSVAQIVRRTAGLQAQDMSAAPLGVRVRSRGLTAADVASALVADRSIVRTWAMRGTLHLVAAEDLAWLLPLLGPPMVAANRSRRAQLGLDDAACALGVRVVRDALASHGPLTRAELRDRLAPHRIPTEGQAMPHLLYVAALEGVICHGPPRGAVPRYVLLSDWLPPGGPVLSREAALAELARRYLRTYGPAAPEDLAAWSGLGLRECRQAWASIASDAIEVRVAGRPSLWMPRDRASRLDEVAATPSSAPPVVRLLGAFDAYLLGYRSRAVAVAPAHDRRVNRGGGWLLPSVAVDGRVVATWSAPRTKVRLDIAVTPFEDDGLPAEVYPGLEEEAADLGRFLGAQVRLETTAVTTQNNGGGP